MTSTQIFHSALKILLNIVGNGNKRLAASLVPVEPVRSGATLADLRKIVQAFPHLDRSDTSFEADVIAAATSQPAMPEALSWE